MEIQSGPVEEDKKILYNVCKKNRPYREHELYLIGNGESRDQEK